MGSSASSSGRAAPASTAATGRQESSTATAPYAATQARLLAGRSDQGPRARFWIRSAGEPDQYSPAGTAPKTDEPGATSASLPDVGAGQSMLRAPTRARAPTRTGPRCTTSPSTQKPLRSTSGSIEQPAPSRSMPVTGGRLCRSTSRPTSAPSSRAYQVIYGAPAQPGGAQLVDHALGQPQPQVDLAAARVLAGPTGAAGPGRRPRRAASGRAG